MLLLAERRRLEAHWRRRSFKKWMGDVPILLRKHRRQSVSLIKVLFAICPRDSSFDRWASTKVNMTFILSISRCSLFESLCSFFVRWYRTSFSYPAAFSACIFHSGEKSMVKSFRWIFKGMNIIYPVKTVHAANQSGMKYNRTVFTRSGFYFPHIMKDAPIYKAALTRGEFPPWLASSNSNISLMDHDKFRFFMPMPDNGMTAELSLIKSHRE